MMILEYTQPLTDERESMYESFTFGFFPFPGRSLHHLMLALSSAITALLYVN